MTGGFAGVDEAIVPPMPDREVGVAMLGGAFRVMEQPVGRAAANGAMSPAFCFDVVAVDMLLAEALLNLRPGEGADCA